MIPLTVLSNDNDSRRDRDRLELVTALISAPSFDPLYRGDHIVIPRDHPVYGWGCQVSDCERPRMMSGPNCNIHHLEWKKAQAAGQSQAEFVAAAKPLRVRYGVHSGVCRICPERPTLGRHELCRIHMAAWSKQVKRGPVDYEDWVSNRSPLPGFGQCGCVVCPYPAAQGRWKLCDSHYIKLIGQVGRGLSREEMATAVKQWCVDADPVYRFDVINLRGLSALARAEFQWGLHTHAQTRHRSNWDPSCVQRLVNLCRRHGYLSMADLSAHDFASTGLDWHDERRFRSICNDTSRALRLIYNSTADTKEAGYIETDHFGRRFDRSGSTFDLTVVPQCWLRDLLWERFADILRSTECPRSRSVFDQIRRAINEFAAFLQADAPQGGHDPRLLREEHAHRFVADQHYRERHHLNRLGSVRANRDPGTVTADTRREVFNRTRQLLYWALQTGRAAQVGLDFAFIAAIPGGGTGPKKSRNPFSDNVARALADEDNLRKLQTRDSLDLGLRDVWEAIVFTGRRCREVTELRLDCVGRYGGLPLLWHDQTKVGNLDESIRIPETLYQRIQERSVKTLARFEDRHGRPPTANERATLALFPTTLANPDLTRSISYSFFNRAFRDWVNQLDLPKSVAHQARHTLATNLLRAGATLAHIRKYLGHVSDRMAEHYVKIAHSDLEHALQAVWVAGPGSAHPGELLSDTTQPLTREQALTLALDLSRRSTPAEGGFCTFQPVVHGGACPWNLNCQNCDHFVLSGADLLYWRRKQEQWRCIAERAPDDATADYLHQVFEPTAKAIAGLEKALAGIGLLDEALQLDMRRPQDYFHRIWATAFPATQLAALDTPADDTDADPEAQ